MNWIKLYILEFNVVFKVESFIYSRLMGFFPFFFYNFLLLNVFFFTYASLFKQRSISTRCNIAYHHALPPKVTFDFFAILGILAKLFIFFGVS